MKEVQAAMPEADIELDEELSFWGEYCCRDDRHLFSTLDTMFANDCSVFLKDKAGMVINGEIALPMLSDVPIEFEGFKIDESAQMKSNAKSWATFDTARISYGSSWAEQ